MCVIRIKRESVDYDKKAVLRAVKLIKNKSIADYKYICDNVDSIVLGKCIQAKPDGPRVININTNGCYLKGSKSVYINLASNTIDENYDINTFSETILKYAKESNMFWKSK